MDQFYSDGGTTTFVDRLAASLGIHASTIKIVGVYTGSLIVDYVVHATDTTTPTELQALQQKQIALIASGQLNLGAPILDFAQNSETVVNDGILTAAGYDPVIITGTATNAGGVSTRVEPEGYVWTDTSLPMNTQTEAHGDIPTIGVIDENTSVAQTEEAEERSTPITGREIMFIALIIGMLLCFGFTLRYVSNRSK